MTLSATSMAAIQPTLTPCAMHVDLRRSAGAFRLLRGSRWRSPCGILAHCPTARDAELVEVTYPRQTGLNSGLAVPSRARS